MLVRKDIRYRIASRSLPKNRVQIMGKRIKTQPGDFLCIPLGNKYAFGRILDDQIWAFYNLSSNTIACIDKIGSYFIAFKLWVHVSALSRWMIIGNKLLEEDLKKPVLFSKQDPINGRISIYLPGGTELDSTYEEARHFERAAVWDPEAVEDRLRDLFEGKPNLLTESLRLKKR